MFFLYFVPLIVVINPFSEKVDNKIIACKIKKKYSIQAISFKEFKDLRTNSLDLDEMAYEELPHHDLHCLKIHLFFWYLALLHSESIQLYTILAFLSAVGLKY